MNIPGRTIAVGIAWSVMVLLFSPRGWGEESPTPAAPPLWLGSPGADLKTALAAYRAKADADRRWETETNLNAYDHVGTRDARWDDDARKCIRLASLPASTSSAELLVAAADQKSACLRALSNGCTDPFVVEIGTWLGVYRPGVKDDEQARVYTEVESAMAASSYPALCKFVAAANAVEKDIDRRIAADNTIGQQTEGYALPARRWPRGTDIKAAFEHACAQLQTLVKDPAAAPSIYMLLAAKTLRAANSDPVGRAEMLVPLAKFFETDESKDHPTHAFKLVEGRFWTEYAWDARGTAYADGVTPEGWKLFGERLDKARAALTAAWKLDPADVFAPRYMITVTMGQSSGRDEMETWFRRAMDARPNDHAAGTAKMLFLEPKWGGSWADVLEFGRQCYATQDWSTRMAMLLLHAHIQISKATVDPKAYWKEPAVWADVQKLYTGYLVSYPKSVFDRTAYALYAAHAEQWKIAHAQFELVGDKPSDELLHLDNVPRKEYDRLRKQAAADGEPAATPSTSPR